MPDPLPGHWYWHRTFECPVYAREIYPDGTADYDRLIINGSEGPSVAQGVCWVSELDPWPIRGLCIESLMERRQTDE